MGAGSATKNAATSNNANGSTNGQLQQQQTGSFGGFGAFGSGSGANGQGGGMANVASSFAFTNKNGSASESKFDFTGFNGQSFSDALKAQNTSTTLAGSTFSDPMSSSSFSSLLSQPTGATTMSNSTSATGTTISPTLKPQTTGFGGMKAFKPTSSFGAALLESLPSIPGSVPNTPAASPSSASANGTATTNGFVALNANPASPNGFGGTHPVSSNFGALNAGATGSMSGFGSGGGLGVGLRPHMTGGGAANPFRASMTAGAAMPSGMFNMGPAATGAMSSNMFGGSGPSFGSNFTARAAQNPQKEPSLI
jgi:hypothetical protein